MPLKKFQCRYNAVEDKGVEFCIDIRNWDLEVNEPILTNSVCKSCVLHVRTYCDIIMLCGSFSSEFNNFQWKLIKARFSMLFIVLNDCVEERA